MSSVLQECGFEPEDIRVVLDERATTQHPRTLPLAPRRCERRRRARALLFRATAPRSPDTMRREPDHLDECLVPYRLRLDAGARHHRQAVRELYSQLPYGSRFVAIFDCCHSGGHDAEGGPAAGSRRPTTSVIARSRWKPSEQMWEPRPFRPEPESRERKMAPTMWAPMAPRAGSAAPWGCAPCRTRNTTGAQRTRTQRTLSADPPRGVPGTGAVLRVPRRRDVLRRVHVLHGKGAAG